MATSLGNLSSVLGITLNILPLPGTQDKFRAPAVYVDNNTFGISQRTLRFTTIAAIEADGDLTAAEKLVAQQILASGCPEVIVVAELTADATTAAALDAVRDEDDDWYYLVDAQDDATADANKQAIAVWVETTDADERGGKFYVTQSDTAGIGTTPHPGTTTSIGDANATNANERTMHLWLAVPVAGNIDGIAAAAWVGHFAKHNRAAKAPSWAFMVTELAGDTFDSTEETNALTYAGTSLLATNIHGQAGQVHPGNTGSAHAGETINAADMVWTDITTQWALNLSRKATKGLKAYPFDDSGFAALAADAKREIVDKITLSGTPGWIADDIPHDDDGTGGSPISVTFTRLRDLVAGDITAKRAQLEISFYTRPGTRFVNAAAYVQES